eukprot:462414-Rhodomonas_salina.2
MLRALRDDTLPRAAADLLGHVAGRGRGARGSRQVVGGGSGRRGGHSALLLLEGLDLDLQPLLDLLDLLLARAVLDLLLGLPELGLELNVLLLELGVVVLHGRAQLLEVEDRRREHALRLVLRDLALLDRAVQADAGLRHLAQALLPLAAVRQLRREVLVLVRERLGLRAHRRVLGGALVGLLALE